MSPLKCTKTIYMYKNAVVRQTKQNLNFIKARSAGNWPQEQIFLVITVSADTFLKHGLNKADVLDQYLPHG